MRVILSDDGRDFLRRDWSDLVDADPAATFFHAFWKIDDPAARRTQQSSFYRNVMMLGSSLVTFGTFASLGGALRFALTAPLFKF